VFVAEEVNRVPTAEEASHGLLVHVVQPGERMVRQNDQEVAARSVADPVHRQIAGSLAGPELIAVVVVLAEPGGVEADDADAKAAAFGAHRDGLGDSVVFGRDLPHAVEVLVEERGVRLEAVEEHTPVLPGPGREELVAFVLRGQRAANELGLASIHVVVAGDEEEAALRLRLAEAPAQAGRGQQIVEETAGLGVALALCREVAREEDQVRRPSVGIVFAQRLDEGVERLVHAVIILAARRKVRVGQMQPRQRVSLMRHFPAPSDRVYPRGGLARGARDASRAALSPVVMRFPPCRRPPSPRLPPSPGGFGGQIRLRHAYAGQVGGQAPVGGCAYGPIPGACRLPASPGGCNGDSAARP